MLHVLWEQRLWGVVCGGEVGSKLCSREGGRRARSKSMAGLNVGN